ncbi:MULTISPECIES: metalloregulator ArsR/SmtB family transcription factor [unclassified Paenibacillus]|uniref:ArsR/SmtB family transcription factor n=1 Tax=unclassified Paenibacillus TaxID=185978 RepID=UPI000955C297|nr:MULTISPECIES: metalloregulator ArsR/SmtB family transcription factor [unclassified Paenibacillus]ASS68285.1 winged helix-turn-helix transcriptional regulator [Paenibacillus sp. RUD330]SIR27516.1 DNA-binding transcriptional regulator, ArsR family [Paenibacillus sp. RU4X]SIR40095.1 DNA-binding transcriptional regulator, ArsR family [Paenibacillus sp. RU4T]
MDITTFGALSEPSRLRIVELLSTGPLMVGEIAERLQIRQPQASKHLKVLLEAGLVDVTAEANRRSYSLRVQPLREMDAWLDRYRRIWEDRYDALEDYLLKLQAANGNADEDSQRKPE